MSGDWRDNVGPDLPTMGLGGLRDGESLVVQFENDGEIRESTRDDWDDALSHHIVLMEAPDGYMAKDDGEEVGAEEGEEYYLMSSSTRYMRNLAQFADNLTGQIVEITASGEDFERTYSITDPSQG
jgi:hypothetical protein